MKTHFTNAQCAHVWAQQTQPHGESSGMHFDGAVIYSYETPIAMFHDTPQGKVCLITSQGYSPTTKSKHLGPVRTAVRGDVPTFVVPWVGYDGCAQGRDDSERSHVANMKFLIDDYQNIADRARKRRNDLYELHTRLTRAAQAAKGYAKAFGQPRPYFAPLKLYDAIMRERAERDTPEGKAKRAKAAAARKAKETREYAARVSAWRAGDAVTLVNGSAVDEHGGALLRIVKRGPNLSAWTNSGDYVQTSLGAEVPLTEAKRLLAYVYSVLPVSGDVHCDTIMERSVGHFRLNTIHADGSVTIGCHKISAQEIERFAAALKFRNVQEPPDGSHHAGDRTGTGAR